MRRIYIHKFLNFILLGVLSTGSIEAALVQVPPPPVTDSTAQAQAATGVDPQPAVAAGDPGAKEPRGSIVIAPLPIVSPAIGAGIVPVFG